MTFEKLSQIIEENSIPKNAIIMSDSGWECNETNTDGVFYDIETNTIILTQSAYCIENKISEECDRFYEYEGRTLENINKIVK